MLFIYTLTLFISASLLFWVQPMFGKMILPYFGSSPNVWNTCMVFYQACLLLGYVYAHVSISKLGIKKQAILHLALILLPLLFLPIAIPKDWSPPGDKNPIPYLLLIMSVTIGLPFFVLSSSAPMLQKWFSSTKHEAAKDPYFLYVASNLGSMLALVSFPIYIEPNLRLITQSRFWHYSYFIFIVFVFLCAYFLFKLKSLPVTENINLTNNTQTSEIVEDLKNEQKIKWVLLSFVPSSLMLGVTTYFSTDVSPVPLIWIVPLALYLLTFIIVFSKDPFLKHEDMVKIMPYVVLASLVFIFSRGRPIWFVFFLHLLVFFVCAMVCHGELAKTRPHTKHLTEFYLWISVGGCLGGIFNAIIAPVIFKEVIEYPLVLVLACLLKPPKEVNKEKEADITLLDDLIFAVIPALMIVGLKYWIEDVSKHDSKFLTDPWWLRNALMYGLPALFVASKYTTRQLRFGLGVGAIVLVYAFYVNAGQKNLYVERNFFGIHRVAMDRGGNFISLYHNTTLHGSQNVKEKDVCNPTTYYSREGPVGQLFKEFENDQTKTKVAALGVGTGSVSCYGRKDQNWVFYEIDPDVVKLNNENDFFTYLKVSDPETFVVLGDGRLKLNDAPKHFYDFIILDAFSSDAIPVHLLTKEALRLYLSKLKNDGIIAFHTSNRYLNLPPIVGNLAENANLSAIIEHDQGDSCAGRMASEWILVARKKEDFGNLASDRRWQPLAGDKKLKVWTDDYSNIFSIFDWGKF